MRYYDAAIGRWSQQDPLRGSLADPTSLNRYLYAGDDPVNFTDPSGRDDIFGCFMTWVMSTFTLLASITGLIAALLAVGAKYAAALAAFAAAGAVTAEGEVIGLMAFEFVPILLSAWQWIVLILAVVGVVAAAWGIAYAIVHCVLHQE